MKKIKTIFLATSDITLPCLEFLCSSPIIDLVAVVSQPSKPQGRGMQEADPPVVEYIKNKKLNVQIFQEEKINLSNNFIEFCHDEKIDLFIVYAFSQFLSDEILNLPNMGSFNIHTSLLPAYRGAAPIHHALYNGDKITGVSIQKMVKKMDAGDVVKSLELVTDEYENQSSLYLKLKNLSVLALSSFLNDLYNHSLVYKRQNDEAVTYAPKIEKEDGYLDFLSCSAEQIERKVRAFSPWPGVYCFIDQKRTKVHSLLLGAHRELGLVVNCSDDTCVTIQELQLPGKKRMSALDYINGLQINKITINQEIKVEIK